MMKLIYALISFSFFLHPHWPLTSAHADLTFCFPHKMSPLYTEMTNFVQNQQQQRLLMPNNVTF